MLLRHRARALLLLASLAFAGCEEEGGPGRTSDVLDAVLEELPVSSCSETGDGGYVLLDLGIDFEASAAPEGAELRVLDYTMGGGVAVLDLTGDDRPDLLFTSVWGDNQLWRNTGDGGFVSCPDSGLEAGDRTYGASAVDLDFDGLREVVLFDAGAVRLFQNDGDCTFSERAPIHRISNPLQRPMNAAWADYDRDGLLDVYVSVRNAAPFDASSASPDVLLRGLSDFRFRDVSVQLGPAGDRSGHAFASSWIDLDHDGDLDHYVANDHGATMVPNRLFLREGPNSAPRFVESSADFALDVGVNGMGLGVGDVDGDGYDEIAVSDTASFRLLSTQHSGPAVDVTAAWGLVPRSVDALASWGMEFADVDHDADLDLLVSWGWKEFDREAIEPDDLWLWEDGFVHAGDQLAFVGQATGRTVVPVDLDADGSLEIVSTSLVGGPAVQKRPCPDAAWLEVSVSGTAGNPAALGALVEIEAGGVTQRRRIGQGSTGVHSAREPVAHFGLGSARSVDVLRVVLPGGEVVEATDVTVPARLRVEVPD